MTIEDICELLEKEHFVVQLLKKDENVPIDRCVILLELDDKNSDEGLLLEIILVPDMEEQLGGLHLLQFSVSLPIDDRQLSEEIRQTLKEVMLACNTYLPIGAFGYARVERFYFFKANTMLSPHPTTDEIMLIRQMIWMMMYEINMFFPVLEKIVSKNISIEEAFSKINQNFNDESL